MLFLFNLFDTNLQISHHGFKLGWVRLAEVSKQALALPQHLEQTSLGIVVLLVGFEMSGEVYHARRQERNLHLCRSAVRWGTLELGHLGR